MSTEEKEIKFISKKNLKEGEIYTITDNHYLNKILIHKYKKMNDEDRSLGSFLTDFNDKWEFRSQSTPYLTGRNISISTPEEKHWFLECEKADKFIPYDKAMETFGKPKPFKFNIGDEIKAKLGGYYFCDPERFEEQHKISFPSSESRISGKITERTQAQGFNWYKCGYGGNWITEEGVELVKEDIPEYIEYIDTKYKGQIVKVEEWKSKLCIPILQFSLNNEFIKEWKSAKEIGLNFNVDSTSFIQCCKHKQKTAYGFIWKYKDKTLQKTKYRIK